MEEMVNVIPPLPQGVWRGCSSRGLQSNSLAAASAPPLAACEGPLTGALTLADVQRAPLPTVAAPRALLPLAQEGVRRVARMTPHPPSSPRRPHEPSRRGRDELRPACCSPTWRAKCRGVVNHSRVAEYTRLSPEGEYSGVS